MNDILRLTGTCYNSDECQGREGSRADGLCARGFGVCCIQSITGCGGNVQMNGTHIQSTGYPGDTTAEQTCTYNLVKIDKEICFFRLDFVNFNIAGPSVTTDAQTSWDCNTDSVTFTTPSSNPPPTICGYNNGQHMYMDASVGLDSNPAMVITTTGTK